MCFSLGHPLNIHHDKVVYLCVWSVFFFHFTVPVVCILFHFNFRFSVVSCSKYVTTCFAVYLL